MTNLQNIKGWYVSNNEFSLLKESKDKDKYIQGLLLPRDEISRNGVLYDWDSIKEHHKELIGKPMLFNHDLEITDRPVGKFTNSWLLEKNDGEDIAGWYYKAKLNKRSQYYDDVIEGFINKVSIQLNASKVTPEFKDGKEYERAYIGDILEASGVNVAGYDQTNIETRIAEAYKDKKFLEDYTDEFKKGFKIEKGEHPELKDDAVKQSVIDNLKKDNTYYSNENKIEDINTATAVGAVAPTKMKKDITNKEDDNMSKKEEVQKTPEEITKVKTEQEDDEKKKVIEESNEDTEKDKVLKEEYDDDMTKVVEALELIKDENKSLKEELDSIKDKLPKEESVEEDEEKTKTEDADTAVVPNKKTDKEKKESEDSEDDEEKKTEDLDEEEVEEPIPPKTEKSKLSGSLKEKAIQKEMTYKEAIGGFVKNRLKI